MRLDVPALIPANAIPYVFNADPRYLSKWRKARANVRSGGANGKVLCVGDSTTYGYGSNAAGSASLKTGAWPAQLASLLQSAHNITAQANAFFGDGNTAALSGGSLNVCDPRITVGSSWTAGVTSLGHASFTASTTTNSLDFLPTVNVDSFDIYYVTNGGLGTFSWSINGGAATNQSTNTTAGVGKLTVTGSLTANTLHLKWVSGGSVYILGIDAYDSSAKTMSVMNAGWVGATSSDWAPATNVWDPAKAIAGVAPDLTIICLGINDWNGAVSAASFTANAQTVITQAKTSGDVLLVSPPPTNTAATAASAQSPIVQAHYALAVSNSCPLIDLNARWVDYTTSNALGYYKSTDSYHPSKPGYSDMASIIGSVLGNT